MATKWNSVYGGVFAANVVISLADKIKDELSFTGEQKDFYTESVAQARFIRAFWHFEGVKLFGAAIPYVGSEEYEANVNPQVSNLDESNNYIYIWDKIIEDFQFAYDNLPDIWSVDKGKANKWAAGAFLAKVKMYQSSAWNGNNGRRDRWNEVVTLLEEIIPTEGGGKDNEGTPYRLANTYEELYVAGTSDWSGESVFDIQMAISGTQTNTNAINGGPHIGMSGALGNNGWGFYQPSHELVNSHIVDANGLPYLDGYYQSVPRLTTVIEGTNTLKTDREVYTDPRLDISTGRFEIPYWDWDVPTTTDGWIRELSNGGPYLNKKNIPLKADNGSSSVPTVAGSTAKNFHLIRYADVLLWYAEALIETNQLAKAGQYINMVRARAANGYVTAVDPASMESTTSQYVLEDLVNGTTGINAAANYRVGLWPASQFATKESATAALRFERKIEMAMEGHRWYDLARWGIAGPELNNYLNYEQQYLTRYAEKSYDPSWIALPIPQNQIITMEGLLVQNEVWK